VLQAVQKIADESPFAATCTKTDPEARPFLIALKALLSTRNPCSEIDTFGLAKT
jgi:hypothetical protein